jgi:hypothetical protein
VVRKALSPVSTAYVESGSAFEAPLRRSKAGATSTAICAATPSHQNNALLLSRVEIRLSSESAAFSGIPIPAGPYSDSYFVGE